MEIFFDKNKCKGCGLCISACPKNNIRMSKCLNDAGYPVAELVADDDCTRCGLCCQMCPDIAIEISVKKSACCASGDKAQAK